jgi:hypothetical protein
MAPEVGLGSIITQMFEFTINNYNDFRHLSSTFCHVSNGVLHYNFLTVLLTVLAVPKKQISSDTDITHSVKMEKLPQHSICNLRRGSESNESLTMTSLIILIYKGILTLILRGFKRFLALHATYRYYHGTYPPPTRLLKNSLKVSFKDFCIV